MVKKKVRRALSRVRGRSLRQRCASVLIAALIVSTAVVGALGPALGPASPTGEAEGISLVPDSKKAFLAIRGYNPQYQTAVTVAKFINNDVNRSGIVAAEKYETKLNINQMAATQRQNNEVLLQSYRNYLEDTKSIATMVGVNAYIRALNNQTSEAKSRSRAIQAAYDYYAVKDLQLIKQWGVTIQTAQTAFLKAQSGNVRNHVYWSTSNQNLNGYASSYDEIKITSTDWSTTATVQISNGSSVTVAAPKLTTKACSPKYGCTTSTSEKIHPYKDMVISGSFSNSRSYSIEINGLKTQSVNTSTSKRVMYGDDWTAIVDRINQQTADLTDRMNNVVNQTYSKYQAGEINSSELISPLNYARNYSPKQDAKYGTYSLSLMSSLGKSLPSNLSGFRKMNITANGSDYEGMLLSDGLPPGGQFNVSQTYNTTNLPGEQLIQTDRGIVEIPENTSLRINSVVGTDGQTLNKSKIKYRDTSYDTTSIKDFKQTMENLRELQAQINARQQNLTSSGSGGGLGGGSGSLFAGFAGLLGLGLSGIKVALLIGGVVVLILVVGS